MSLTTESPSVAGADEPATEPTGGTRAAHIAWGVVLLVLLAAPWIISGLILALTALSLAFIGLRWLWRCRGSLRLWRSPTTPFQTRARRDLL